jgi:hypothetical protein
MLCKRRRRHCHWIKALKGSGVNLEDLGMLGDLSNTLGHCDFQNQGLLKIEIPLDREA